MPDRELPRQLRDRLTASLEAGAPLVAPLPSQARFATARGAVPSPRWRLRALTVAVAGAGIAVVAFAGPPQPREWISQSVTGITKQVGIPAGEVSPSPTQENQSTGQSPEGAKTPAARLTPQPRQSPEPHESPEAGQSSDDDRTQPSPGASPSPAPSPSPGFDH